MPMGHCRGLSQLSKTPLAAQLCRDGVKKSLESSSEPGGQQQLQPSMAREGGSP